MGNIRIVASTLLALTAAACGDDGGGNTTIDAQVIVDAAPIDTAPVIDTPPAVTYDFSCYQNTAPTTAPTNVVVSGTAQELAGQALQPAAGVVVTACKGDCVGPNNLGASAATTSNGTFSTVQVATGGVPLDGYMKATKTGALDTYLYPHASLDESLTGAPVLMLTSANVDLLELLLQEMQLTTNGLMGVAATDCANPPVGVAGATVTVTAGGVAVGSDPYDLSALLPDASGTYLIMNVPPGEVTINASFVQNGTTYNFLANGVNIIANTVTTAQVKPGY